MSLQDYLNIQSQVSGSIGQQEDQLFDKVNDAKVFKKSTSLLSSEDTQVANSPFALEKPMFRADPVPPFFLS